MSAIRRKEWDSEFFGRDIFEANFDYSIGSKDAEAIVREIASLRHSDRLLIQARVRSEYFTNIPILEEIGFRLVDSRLEFSTKTYRRDFMSSHFTESLRWYRHDDWAQIRELTISQFVDNQNFQSRFNNRQYFTRDESLRYYLQWHRLVLENPHPLFCVWETGSSISGFYSIVRKPGTASSPDYKVALAAVRPGSPGSGMQNKMQFWIFQNCPDTEWSTINSPALTNLPGLKNNIRAGKELSHVEAYLFWSC